MSFKIKRQATDDAEIDVTSFMNLMIVLVPVLLMSMTFTKITVMEINLPELSGGNSVADLSQSQLEVVIHKDKLQVYFPAGSLVKDIEMVQKKDQKNKTHDFYMLTQVLRSIKDKVSDKKDAVILSASDLPYQTLITVMDTVKSYQTVVAASLVEIELFPQISLGDASKTKKGK
jgi:biopolymer transport protein ExbD